MAETLGMMKSVGETTFTECLFFSDVSFTDETAHETSEKPREHVIRYLETLTAWFDASVTLIRHKPFSKPLVVYKFTVPHPNLSVSVDEITAFKNNYLDGLSEQGLSEDDQIKVQQFLDKICITPNETKKATIHAEASLMALGCDLQRSYKIEACNRNAIRQVFNVRCLSLHIWQILIFIGGDCTNRG